MDTRDAIEAVLVRFGELSEIPRGSGNEEAARAHIEAWAHARGLPFARDATGNLLVRVPATAGDPGAPAVVLQGHLDMVCEKTPDSTHDFARDPITPVRDGEWVRARGTTLGADNGIAVALAMVVAEDVASPHPPLELLFTVEEETGLRGAAALGNGFMSGLNLLNLDSEAEGVLTVGCAGGKDTILTLPLPRGPSLPQLGSFRLGVSGLSGGHSGVDIHLGRANANILLARALKTILKPSGAKIAAMEGGSARNAIPRDAAAVLSMPAREAPAAAHAIEALEKELRMEYAATEPKMRIELAAAPSMSRVFAACPSDVLLHLLLALPNGVAGMSREFPGTVETSNNLGVVRTTQDGVEIVSSQRSSSAAALKELTSRIESVAALAGASVRSDTGYPPWQPDLHSALLRRATEAWRARRGRTPEVRIIHAGLECAVIGSLQPGVDMVSLGPTIQGAHSPDERLHVPSLDGVWELVTEVLASFTRDPESRLP